MKKIVIIIPLIIIVAYYYLSDDKVMENYVGLDINELKENYQWHYVDSNFKEGIIVSQNIEAGQKVDKKIILEVSNGLLDFEKYQYYQVNELGRVPIMMYHGVFEVNEPLVDRVGGNYDKAGYHRTVEGFRSDLDFFYENNYRMIRLEDYILGNIDVEIGKSPIVLTFDDGLENNIRVLGKNEKGLIIDPNSAVGILEEYKNKHPDFNVTATFFLNGGLFRQPTYNYDIIEWLIENNYDIGNHGFNHINLGNATQEEVFKEIGQMDQLLKKVTNNRYIPVVALPFGVPNSKEHDNFTSILNGSYLGNDYQNIATLRVGWRSNPSPFVKTFDREFLMRIRAYDNNGKEFDIEYVFGYLENSRYVSSGNSEIVVFPKDSKIEYKTDKRVIKYERND